MAFELTQKMFWSLNDVKPAGRIGMDDHDEKTQSSNRPRSYAEIVEASKAIKKQSEKSPLEPEQFEAGIGKVSYRRVIETEDEDVSKTSPRR